MNRIEIMDSTLRDGEQTNGVSFLPHEKLMIARNLLYSVNVDRIEIASAGVSECEREAVSKICVDAQGTGNIDRVEVLGFVDGKRSVDWIDQCGCRVMNLLSKGSRKHCEQQLHKSPEEHINDIIDVLEYADKRGVSVNLYLEDWSSGMINSPDYVFNMIDKLCCTNIKRFLLPDTLGILNPVQCGDFMRQMTERYPSLHFDFHAHNDYGMAVANSFMAVKNGCRGLHVTVNGLGERCGNSSLASMQAVMSDQLGIATGVDEARLNDISRLVEGYSGVAVAPNEPIVGENVFTQVAGVHADGDNKNNLYCNALLPERFGRHRTYALGKNSGNANISKNLKELGLQLSKEQTKLVTKRIVELGDRKEMVTQADLPYIVSDVLNVTKHDHDNLVVLKNYLLSTAYELKPVANVKIEISGHTYMAEATGDGQYDAFVNALRKIYRINLSRELPILENYAVSIPPGGHTDALVQTVISWRNGEKTLRTRGIDSDQTAAAIKATVRMLNILENEIKTTK